jgi:hypothetical protein
VRPILVFEGEETADDRIAREAAELDGPYWLVTSDRGLRDRAAPRAERVIGGGSFARELRGLARPGEELAGQDELTAERPFDATERQRDRRSSSLEAE